MIIASHDPHVMEEPPEEPNGTGQDGDESNDRERDHRDKRISDASKVATGHVRWISDAKNALSGSDGVRWSSFL